MGIRLGGIQPVYLPWLGYFDQIRRVDLFVIADEMPYSSSGWLHRNRVLGPDGPHWLTLPARSQHNQTIRSVRLDAAVPWKRKHLTTLAHFYAHGVELEETLAALDELLPADAPLLTQVTVPLLRYLVDRLGITTPIVVSSELELESKYRQRFPEQPGPTHRIIAYMEALGASELLEGESGQSYFDIDLFHAHGFGVQFHRYQHPVYPQLHQPFVSHLSVIDLLLSVGTRRAREVLAAGRLRDA